MVLKYFDQIPEVATFPIYRSFGVLPQNVIEADSEISSS